MTSKKKQLFIESSEFTSKIKLNKKLKESVKLSSGKNGTLIVRNVPVTVLNRRNQNGRIYSTAVVQEALDNARALIESKQLLSQACEHPEGSYVSPTTASHVIIGAYIKKGVNLVVEGQKGKFDVLFNDWEVLNTEEGKNLRALFEAECSIGTSIRGVGDLDGENVIDYEFLGTDCVGNPSSSTFTRMPVSESVKVEVSDKDALQENFVVTTASTNVVGDLDKASVIQAQLDNATYGTVVKTSTKLDSEVDPKTGATTSITTLEAETEDEVGDLDQALVMAKNAMLNGLVNVDSVTIENVKDEDENNGGKKKESAPEYVPEDEMPMKEEDKDAVVEAPVTEGVEEMKEAKKEEDPKAGRKFVLKTPNGYVAMDGNALVFKADPKEALHFIVGKEESGLVHLSGVEKILDTMGVYDVQKYYKNPVTDISAPAEEDEKKEANILDGTPANPVQGQEQVNANLDEGNTRFVAEVKTQGADDQASNVETIPVSGTELESILSEVSNLWQQKAKGNNPNLQVTVKDTQTGEAFIYDPKTNTLNPVNAAPAQVMESDDAIEQDDNTLKMTVNPDDEEPVEIEKEFDTKAQADAAKAGMEQEKIDGSIMLNEKDADAEIETDIVPGWYAGIPDVGISGPFKTEEEAWAGLEPYKDIITVQYLGGDKEEMEEAGAGAAVGAGLGSFLGPVGTVLGGAAGSLAQDYFSKDKTKKPGWKAGALIGGALGGVPGALIGGGLQHMLTNKKDGLPGAITNGAKNLGNKALTGMKNAGSAISKGYKDYSDKQAFKKEYDKGFDKAWEDHQKATNNGIDQVATDPATQDTATNNTQADTAAYTPDTTATQTADTTAAQVQAATDNTAQTQQQVQAVNDQVTQLQQGYAGLTQSVQELQQTVLGLVSQAQATAQQQAQQQQAQQQAAKKNAAANKKAARKVKRATKVAQPAVEASMDEKLYTEPSMPSDPVVDTPLEEEDTAPEMKKCEWCGEEYPADALRHEKDLGYICDVCARAIESKEGKLDFDDTPVTEAGKDIIVKLANIDWDVDSLISGSSDSDWDDDTDLSLSPEEYAQNADDVGDDLYATISNLPDTLTVRLQGVNVAGLKTAEEVKQAIIDAANEQTTYRINDADIKAIY